MSRLVDRLGHTYRRLTVLEQAPSVSSRPGARWRCLCTCGNVVTVLGGNLGKTNSCGCLRREVTRDKSITHGHTTNLRYTPTYHTWAGMKARCTNSNHSKYSYYGGRGIKIHDDWMQFKNFLADMGERPEGLSLDRIDPDGDYEPNNCRWADRETQARNQSRYVSKTS